MATVIRGELWSELETADLVLFTGNSTVDRFGRLVMGAGCAAEAKERFPELAARIGADLRERGLVNREYLLWLPDEWEEACARVGALQTKCDWYRPSNPALIARSLTKLAETLAENGSARRVAMPLPGTGCGGLTREAVLPLLSVLPEYVYVYEGGVKKELEWTSWRKSSGRGGRVF